MHCLHLQKCTRVGNMNVLRALLPADHHTDGEHGAREPLLRSCSSREVLIGLPSRSRLGRRARLRCDKPARQPSHVAAMAKAGLWKERRGFNEFAPTPREDQRHFGRRWDLFRCAPLSDNLFLRSPNCRPAAHAAFLSLGLSGRSRRHRSN